MNNFFASVECLKDKSMLSRPVAVCGSVEERHGIVLAKNEEAKKYGITTGESVIQALAKCKELIIVEPHYDEYVRFSRLARKIYLDYTDMVEPFGADECWLDVTGSRALFGDGETIAHTIRQRIKEELGLTISAGVSFNKTFAKLGSDMKKPDAVTMIGEKDFREKIWHLPASDLMGIGRATSQALKSYGIHTIGQLACAYPPMIQGRFGKNGLRLIEIANGRDADPVIAHSNAAPLKSISHGTTTATDLCTPREVKTVMLALCEEIGHKLLSLEKKASTVVIHLRDCSLFSKQYQCRLPFPTDSYSEIALKAFDLMQKKHVMQKPLRSVTVGVTDLISADFPCQMSFFTDISGTARRETLDRVMDLINCRYGDGSIRYGVLFKNSLSDVGEGFGFGRVGQSELL